MKHIDDNIIYTILETRVIVCMRIILFPQLKITIIGGRGVFV